MTKWSLLYAIKKLRFYYKTDSKKDVRYMDFASFDFSCDSPVKVLNVDTPYRGDVAKYFTDDNYEMNHSNNKNAAQAMGLYPQPMSERTISDMARYPETTGCCGR